MMVTYEELMEVAHLLSAVNRVNNESTLISIGNLPVYDCNGDTLCWIGMSESGEYAVFTTEPEESNA